MPPAITLWRSKRKGQLRGTLHASWRLDGKRQTWDTKVLDEADAFRKATDELNRRLMPDPPRVTAAAEPPAQLADVAPAAPAAAGPSSPLRRPITEVLTRALTSGTSPTNDNSEVPPVPPSAEGEKSARHLYEYFGKAMAYLTEGGLKRACRYAGREPDEMDDSEIELVREGWGELGAKWFGQTAIGPLGKIVLGSAVAGVGMYMGGKEIPPKPKLLTEPPDSKPPGVGGGGA